jgi:hypothetical protein
LSHSSISATPVEVPGYHMPGLQFSSLHLRDRPRLRQHLRLFEHCLRSLLLLVGRVAILSQDAFHDDPQLGANVFAHGPVDGNVSLHRFNQLASHLNQRRLAQHLDGAVVDFQRVFGVCALCLLRFEFDVLSFEGIGNVLEKIRPRTTCLYSAASMLLRSASAACQSFASKPRLAAVLLADRDLLSFTLGRNHLARNGHVR